MQQIKSVAGAVKPLLLIIISASLLSFSMAWGGESFQIYVNNKLVLQQYVSQNVGVKSIQLDKSAYNEQVDVYYSHCGQPGKNRSIAIKDEHNRTLKEWHFADVAGKNSPMSVKVGEILNIKTKGSNNLNLYYFSQQLPNGRLLASVVAADDSKANP